MAGTSKQGSWATRGEDSPHARKQRRRFRRLRRFLAVLMVVPGLSAVGAVGIAAPASAAVVGGFEIDGNTPDDPAVVGVDWGSLPGSFTPDPVGNLDVSNFTEGSKEFEHPTSWVQGTGTAPDQDDISGVYSHVNDADPDNVWAFFGFTRLATSGTTNYDVEYNQADNSSANPARPIRTPGDLMLRFEQDGNTSFELTSAFEWTLQTDPAWIAAASSPDKTDDCISVPGYSPAAGWCPISTTSAQFSGATSADGTFAEGAVNISSLSEGGGGSDCRGAFGTMNIRSFTGESVQSSLKDYVEPIPVSVPPTCWKPLSITNTVAATYDVSYDWSVAKTVDRTRAEVPEGTSASFDYTVTLTAGPEQVGGRELGGTVSLTNPNGADMVATLSTAITGGAACTFPGVTDVDGAEPGLQVVVPDGSTDFAYSCDVATSPQPSGTSTATVTWSEDDYPQDPTSTPPITYTRSAADDYTYAIDQSTDEQTTVTDTFDGGAAEILGTFTWADVYNETNASTPPHTVVVKTYTRTIPGVPGECNDYTDTARQTENDTARTTTSEQTVTVCVASDLSIDKLAGLSYNRTYEWDIAKSGPGTVFVGQDENGDYKRQVTYTVDLTATRYTDSDRLVGGKVFVSNPNEWAVDATLSDTMTVDGAALACTFSGTDADPGTPVFDVVVPAGADRLAFDYTCPNPDQGAYVGTNTATLDWDPGTHVYPDADTSVDRTVDVVVTADPTPRDKTITLTDELEGVVVPLPQSSFDWDTVHAMAGHTQTLTYTRELSTTAGACTPYDNTVTIDQTGQDASHTVEVCAPGLTKTVEADYGQKQLWDLAKDVDRTTVEIAQGGVATFTYTVTATPTQVVDDGAASWTGTVTVTNPSATASLTVDVTDAPQVADWTCSFDGDATERTIAAGATLDLDYTCTGTGHPSGTNTATVTFGGQSVSTTEDVDFTARTAVADSVVTITDDKTDTDTVPVPVLFTADASDQGTWSHTYTLTKTGVAGVCTDYTNTAVLDLTKSDDVSDLEKVTVCVEKPLEVSKTAQGTFARDYDWTIAKTSSAPEATIPEGGTHRFPYAVTASPDGYRDSAWEVHGTITVKNPNAYAAGGIAATVSDQLSGITGATCTVTGPAIELAPGAETTLPYSCELAPTGEDYTGTNVAIATWAPAPTYVPARPESPDPATATAQSANVDVTLALPAGNITDFTVEVYDDPQGPTGPDLLGTADWGETPGTTTEGPDTVFEYDGVARSGTAGTCTTYDNTAWVDEGGNSPEAPGTGDPTGTETVELCVARDLTVDKSVAVAYDRLYNWSLAKSGPGTVFVGDDSTGTATYEITVKAEQPTDSGVSVVGTITVTNPNDFQDVVADVGDTFTLDGVDTVCAVTGGPDGDGQDVTVPRSGEVVVGYTCELADGTWPEDYLGSNQVTVTWDEALYTTPTGEASFTNTVEAPEVTESPAFATIDLVDEITEAGGDPSAVTIPAAYETLTWSEVHAAEGSQVTFPVTVTLAPGLEPAACTTYTNVVSIADSTVGPGTATTEVCRPEVTKSVTADFGQKQVWDLVKDVDKTEVEISQGGVATFTYTVTATPSGPVDDGTASWTGTVSVHNPSASTALTVDVTDAPQVAGWTCSFTGDATERTIEPGATLPLAYECTGAGHPDGTNTATATFGGESVSTTVDVAFEARSEVADSVVTITDDKTDHDVPAGVLFTADASDPETWSHTYTLTQTGVPGECADYTNTAVVDMTRSPDDSDSETVTVCVEKPLTVDVTAKADLARAYAWSIDKVVDATQRTVDPATGKATFRYTVTAKAGASTDSGWQLGGQVSVTNPNLYADGDITADVAVATDLGGGAACVVDGGQDVVVPESGEGASTVTLPYSCTFTSAPASSGTVEATVTWDPAGPDTTATAKADEPVTFGIRSETNKVVDVVDDKTVPGQRVVLEQGLTWAAGLTRTYTYDLALAGGVAGTCATYTNTAVVDLPVGTDPSDSATVKACTPAPEVLPEETGKATGKLRATCLLTLRVMMRNDTGDTVRFALKTGKKVRYFNVGEGKTKRVETKAKARAKVVLKAQGKVLDRLRMPAYCAPPEVLPDTGLRLRPAAQMDGWLNG